jgi:PilZ domain
MLSISSKIAVAPPARQPDVSASPSSPNGPEQRVSARRPAAAVPSITGLRLAPHGIEATLVNISVSGLLAECPDRMKPGTAVTVVFEGTFVPRSVDARVARTSVASMGSDGRLRYHIGMAFSTAITLDDGEGETSDTAPTAAETDILAPLAAPRNRW